MSSTHEGAKAIFLAALEHPTADRARFLAHACGADDRLRDEVESLLAFHEAESGGPGPGRAVPAGPEAFVPGYMFAGRYRIVARLGRGGMGEVWRADDLTLGTPIALKLIHSSSPATREQLLNEVRLARRVTHPAVCRVFDIGEAGNEVFFTMELVDGQDLAAVLRQAGRLAPDRVVAIARQLCDGLAAAHAQGVLHRDLKPANVLLGHDGRIRITDFGIAVPADHGAAAALAGTPLYMAPEQQQARGTLTPRTDIYALGLVLYELATGRHPFPIAPRSGDAVPPSRLTPDLDPALEAVILQCLAEAPADRPASAAVIVSALPTAQPDADAITAHGTAGRSARRPAFTRWSAGLAAVLVLGVLGALGVIAVRGWPSRAAALTAQDTVVLADFTNTTDEPLFDGALKVALAVALEQSPFLRVFPDERVRETLRLMARPPDTPLTKAVTREVALREQLRATLSGSIAPLGRHYVIALEALDAQSGDVIAREQIEVDGKEQVLSGLGSAATRLRERLGESLLTLQKFDVPLPRATTPSLEALHAYALGLEGGRVSVRLSAIPHLQRAIELDPDFAMAQALLSGIYANVGRIALAPAHAKRAFDLRERVSERERYFISWRYYRDALEDFEHSLDLARSWVEAYPREAFAYNSLAIVELGYGQQAEGIAALRTALRLDPKFVSPYVNLGEALMAAGQLDEAAGLMARAQKEGIEFVAIHQTPYLVALMRGDAAGMATHLAAARATREAVYTNDWPARASAFAGRLGLARQEFDRAIRAMEQQNLNEWAARFALSEAIALALLDQCQAAAPRIAQALAHSRNSATLDMASRAKAWCGDTAGSAALDAELAQRFPGATMRMQLSLPLNAAVRAIRAGRFDEGLALVAKVGPLDRSSEAELWPAFLQAQAHLSKGEHAAAARDFQTVMERRGEAPDSLLYPLALLGRARAAATGGDPAGARPLYDQLEAMWRDADPDLAPLVALRRERQALR